MTRSLVWENRLHIVSSFGLEGHRGLFLYSDRRLWERALAATGNGAVRAEEVVEPEIAAMAIANPELMAEPGMGNARQNKHRRQ